MVSISLGPFEGLGVSLLTFLSFAKLAGVSEVGEGLVDGLGGALLGLTAMDGDGVALPDSEDCDDEDVPDEPISDGPASEGLEVEEVGGVDVGSDDELNKLQPEMRPSKVNAHSNRVHGAVKSMNLYLD